MLVYIIPGMQAKNVKLRCSQIFFSIALPLSFF